MVRSIHRDLAERGLGQEQVSAKAYWRRGLPNADHGELASSRLTLSQGSVAVATGLLAYAHLYG